MKTATAQHALTDDANHTGFGDTVWNWLPVIIVVGHLIPV